MDDEMASLKDNDTYILEPLPPGSKAIPVRWLFKKKLNPDGTIRYKARLVAKGFMQREGIDFTDVYAPVSKHTTMRALLALVVSEDMVLRQLDVKPAFLNGELEKTIYMQQPPGYEEGGTNTVCHLQRALYGLRQAPRAWHAKLKSTLEKLGFTESQSDPGLFSKQGD